MDFPRAFMKGAMRQTPNNRRGRGRGNGRKPVGRHHTFDSNGPSVRVRGTAPQLHEKYLTLARDASAAGDRIMAENYYQHADHYYRVLNVNTAEQTPDRSAQRRGPADQDHDLDHDQEQAQAQARRHEKTTANGRRAPQRRSNGRAEDKDNAEPKIDGGEARHIAAAPDDPTPATPHDPTPAAPTVAPPPPAAPKAAKRAKPAKPAKPAKDEAVADQDDEASTPDSDPAAA